MRNVGRPGSSLPRRVALTAIVVGGLQACHVPGLKSSADEGALYQTSTGSTIVRLHGRQLQLRTPGGATLDGLQVIIAGKVYRADNGHLAIPPSALDGLGKGETLVVLAPGYVPRRISLADFDQAVDLTAATSVAKQAVLTPLAAASLRSSDGAFGATFPAGFFASGQGSAELATYHPTVPAPSGVGKTLALGLLLTVSRPLAGPLPTFSFDLGAMLKGWDGKGELPAAAASWTAEQRQNALSAAAILNAAPGADPKALAREGLSLVGKNLTVTPAPNPTRSFDGNVVIAVDSAVLGAYLEFTIVSPAGGDLPAALSGAGGGANGTGSGGLTGGTGSGGLTGGTGSGGLTGGTGSGGLTGGSGIGGLTGGSGNGGLTGGLGQGGTGGIISDSGSGIIANNGSGILSTYGGGILSTYGGGLLSNNGGNMVGEVRAPFKVENGGNVKYDLLAFTDYLVPNSGRVLLADETGRVLGPTAGIDAVSQYDLEKLPQTRPFVFPEAQVGNLSMRALAPAPLTARFEADINAATTGATSWAVRNMALGVSKMKQINYAGYLADVAALRGFMSQTDAQAMATGNVTSDAALVTTLYTTNSYAPQVFNPLLGKITTFVGGPRGYADGTGLGASFSLGGGMFAHDSVSGNFYITDSGNHVIRKVTPAGVVTTIAGVLGGAGSNDGPLATAQFNAMTSIMIDASGNLLVMDGGAQKIRKVDLGTGMVSTLATGIPSIQHAVLGPDGFIYFTTTRWRGTEDNERVYRISPAGGAPSVFAGAGPGGNADGPRGSATFLRLRGLVFDASGNLYLCDQANSAIRRIGTDGMVTTVTRGITYPVGIAYDDVNDLIYVIGAGPDLLMRINVATNGLSFVAGNGLPGRVDGTGAAAGFYAPSMAWFDNKTGLLWEMDGDALRKVQ